MALFDLSDVTRTVINLLEVALINTKHWAPGTEPAVMADLPNRSKKEGLGFFLYHVNESTQYKNYPAPGKDHPPSAYVPMGLVLYYQLSANSNQDDGTGPLQEQLLMGIAIKALHDSPEISDTIPAGNRNRFKITLHNMAPHEAVQYWTAGESPVKLSAFYEVSVVFLEPKETASYAGRVLSYGNYIFVQGAPRITGSDNIIEYRLPAGPAPQQVKIQPAQAPPAHPLPAPPDMLTAYVDSRINFYGTGFAGGKLDLLLSNARWPIPAMATSAWMVKLVAENQVVATVQETALQQDPSAPVTILPGLYGAQIRITTQRALPDSTVKVFSHISNQFPFSVMPRIDKIMEGAGGAVTVRGFLFQHANLLPENIQVYVGESSLALAKADAWGAGKFRIAGADTLELMVPAGLPPGTTPLRIMINGVESPPNWITVS